jgi:hypothetical protein
VVHLCVLRRLLLDNAPLTCIKSPEVIHPPLDRDPVPGR